MMKLLLALFCALLVLPTLAQTVQRQTQVYRCGPDGRDLRDSPSPGGGGGASGVSYDQPSTADGRAARDRHLADAKQAAALAQARRASDAEARHQRASAVGLQAPPPAPAQTASSPAVVQLKPPKTAKPHKPSAAASAGR